MKAKNIGTRFFRIYTAVKNPRYFVNRKVKDRLFRYVFCNDKASLLELYNALNRTSYTNADALEIVTMDSVIYMSMKNDIAFVLYGVIQLYEHQGSFNPNMPVRFLIYLGQEYEKIIARRKQNVYGSKMITLPTPQCIVFYNGSRDMPEEKLLRLSDAYENKNLESSLELNVRMININFGHNKELMQKCRKLYEYSYFVAQIRDNTDQGMQLSEAVDRAVNYCMEKDILSDILEEHRMEVVGMLINEFNERKHWKLVTRAAIEQGKKEGLQIGLEEGRAKGQAEGIETGIAEGIAKGIEKGIAKGIAKGRVEGRTEGETRIIVNQVCTKLKKGKLPHQIADELEESLDKVTQICSIASTCAPEYDTELICKRFMQQNTEINPSPIRNA